MHSRWWYISTLGAVIALLLDRYTKTFFVTHPQAAYGPLSYHLNTAMAFSLPLIPILFYSLMVAALGILLYTFVRSLVNRQLLEYSVALFILVGAYSNALDRWQYGGVIDFIHTPLGSVFNLADVYIVGAIIIWCLYIVRYDLRKVR